MSKNNLELNNQYVWQFLTLEQAECAAEHALHIYQGVLESGETNFDSVQSQAAGKFLMLSDLCNGFSVCLWLDRLWQITKRFQYPAVVDQSAASENLGSHDNVGKHCSVCHGDLRRGILGCERSECPYSFQLDSDVCSVCLGEGEYHLDHVVGAVSCPICSGTGKSEEYLHALEHAQGGR